MAQYNPRTGITSYQEGINLEDLLGGEPVPSASAATAPVAAAAPAAPAPGMFSAPVAPAAPIGGWRWNYGQDNQDWLWDASLDESQGYSFFNDGAMQYYAPPPDPTGQLEYRSLGINEGTDMGSAWFDTGSGLQVNDQAAIQRAQAAQLAAADARVPSFAHLPPDQQWQMAMQVYQALGVEPLARAYKLGKFSPDLSPGWDESLGRFIAARQNEASDRRGFMSHINDSIGTELTHFENIGESWQEDPERAILGINTPLEGDLWGWLLGKDYDSNVNMYGGPTQDTYQEAAEAGYDPGFSAASHGATEGILGGMFGAKLGSYPAMQTPQGSAALSAGRAGFAAANGGDKEGMRAAIISALVAQGVDVASPYVTSWVNDALAAMTGDSVEEVGLSAQGMLADTGDATKRLQLADAGTSTFDVSEPLFSPNSYMNQPGFTGAESSLDATVSPVYGDLQEGVTYAPGSFTGYDPITGQAMFESSTGMLTPEEEAADAENLQVLEAGDAPAEEPAVTSADVQKYAKVAKSLYDILNPDAPADSEPVPADAPQRDEETTDEQYAEQLATYANLDPAAMAEQGLTPGTPEYYEYIMTQMDSIIAQALEGVDVDAEDLADQLRAKTAEEMKSLERALFVRGQMAQLMGSGTYVDPATGLDEEVLAPEGRQVNPARAAYMRGLARSADKLGRLRGGGARDFIGGMLDRDVDFYGMQGRADERAELEEQYLLEDERKRRRGMFGGF